MSTRGILGGTIIVATLVVFTLVVHHQYSVAKKEAADVTKCQNEDGDRVKTPAGFYRGSSGKCIVRTPLPPPAAPIHSCTTPCSMQVNWGQRVAWPEQYDIQIRYQISNDWSPWIPLRNVGGKNVALSHLEEFKQFRPGEVEFAFEGGLQLPVEIYNH